MTIRIEKDSGFCFGVKRAIELAEQRLKKKEQIYCLGEIVHNAEEAKRLAALGLKVVEHPKFSELQNQTVLIRAHGEPPSTYTLAQKNKLELIEGTCPIVQALQKKIRKAWEASDKEHTTLIIYGKKGHPEVIGLNGQTGFSAKVITQAGELEEEKLQQNVLVFSQTTMDTEGFERISEKLRQELQKGKIKNLSIQNTICKHISHREPGLRKFASENDVVIFVSGKNSSNGKVLYSVCKNTNPESYFVSEPGELNPLWFVNSNSVGVCGATSTPGWLMEQVAERISSFTQN